MKFFPLLVGADVALGIPIQSAGDGISGPDLRTVIGATLVALKPDEVTTVTWTPSIVAANVAPYFLTIVTATVAMLRFPFTGTELDTKGLWRVSWSLALPDTPHTWPSAPEDTSIFTVTDKFFR